MRDKGNVFFKVLDIFANFVLLNLLWMVSCLFIVTIFPATTALFATVRKWHKEGTDFGVISTYYRYFIENFRKSFLIGLMWKIAMVFLVMDGMILSHVQFTGKWVILSLYTFLLILFLFLTIYLFFVLVHYELGVFAIIKKNALFLSISCLPHTLACIGCIVVTFLFTYIMPFFLLLIGSFFWHLYYITYSKAC